MLLVKAKYSRNNRLLNPNHSAQARSQSTSQNMIVFLMHVSFFGVLSVHSIVNILYSEYSLKQIVMDCDEAGSCKYILTIFIEMVTISTRAKRFEKFSLCLYGHC